MSGPVPELYNRLLADRDTIYEKIIEGETYKYIANTYDVGLSTLFYFLYNSENSARTKEARQFAAHVLVDKAEEVLAQAKSEPKLFGVANALAYHYRWKASMLNPKEYEKKPPKDLEDKSKKELTIIVKEE